MLEILGLLFLTYIGSIILFGLLGKLLKLAARKKLVTEKATRFLHIALFTLYCATAAAIGAYILLQLNSLIGYIGTGIWLLVYAITYFNSDLGKDADHFVYKIVPDTENH